MIILDTNVISEPARPTPSAAVLFWLDAQPRETLFVTATTIAELLVGIEVMPDGRKKEKVRERMLGLIDLIFGPRVLAFDGQAAAAYASLVAQAAGKGRAVSFADGQIAAIARVHGFAVATRDTLPFEAAGVPVINPWEP
ncbi:hypothetical protein SAMN02982989_2828 [Xaviernesmea oryzae]|uniref:Ribonuclease VapC n=1 Tax=Xaviernesmea oryzae TaxID=464029 RepID=A0A1X7FE83_9HYPH|nr:type II toxin-antitoxin system VapC family toxin [Xaviernesmea oryzae]SMF50744.1 hypothetical protein SAMN02982989_2828 [Xaviernesmea oryzae]